MSNLQSQEKKAYFLFTANGPLVILTSFDSIQDSELLKRIEAKGIDKFIAYELPMASVKEKYGEHYNIILEDLRQSDDFRVLDYSGERAFKLFKLKELGTPVYFEKE